jgi:hypothetical protein
MFLPLTLVNHGFAAAIFWLFQEPVEDSEHKKIRPPDALGLPVPNRRGFRIGTWRLPSSSNLHKPGLSDDAVIKKRRQGLGDASQLSE